MSPEDDKLSAHDALANMADGNHPAPADPEAPEPAADPDDDLQTPDDDELAAGDYGAEAEEPAAVGLGAPADEPPASPEARKARAASFVRRSQVAQNQQMKQFMIPLLMTVGGLLMLIGLLVLGLASSEALRDAFTIDDDNPLVAHGILFGIVSLLLSVILVLGGFLFRMELRHKGAR